MPRKKIAAWKALLAGGLLTSMIFAGFAGGCTSLPESGAPQSFDLAEPTTRSIDQSGFGPQKDSTPQQLINDFLLASSAGYFDDYRTVREYLLPETSADWWAQENVLVYPQDTPPHVTEVVVSGETATVTVEVRALGTVNPEGILAVTDSAPTTLTFELRKDERGQWRIGELDGGVVLSQASFQGSYQAADLFFLTADQGSLVGDTRWFPKKRLPSYLVQELLAGPREELRPVVQTALNESLVLPTRGVELDESTATVTLVGDLPSSVTTIEKLSWQVTATLEQVADISAVNIEINWEHLPQVRAPFGPEYQLDQAVGVRDGEILAGDAATWRTEVPAAEAGADPAMPCRGPATDPTLAWIAADSQLVVHDPQGRNHSLTTDAPAGPTVDRWNWVWTGSPGSPSVTAVNVVGGKRDLPVSADGAGPVSKAMISSDGVRMLLLAGSGADRAVWLGNIGRDAYGGPQELIEVQRVDTGSARVLDADWAGPGHIAVLLAAEEGTEVQVHQLGGFTTSLRGPAGAEQIIGGPGPTRIYLTGADGELFLRTGTIWRETETTVRDICFP